ncbi:hypothetical protein B296_00056927, partial [Ensete ventricosum]
CEKNRDEAADRETKLLIESSGNGSGKQRYCEQRQQQRQWREATTATIERNVDDGIAMRLGLRKLRARGGKLISVR